MTDIGPLALDRSSWPHGDGNSDYSRVSSATLTSSAEPLCSAELPSAGGGTIVVGADGRCFVSFHDRVAAVRPRGQLEWSVETSLRWGGGPVALSGRRLLIFEDPDSSAPVLVIRDQDTGAVLKRLTVDGDGTGRAVPFADGRIALVLLAKGRSSLQMLAPGGTTLWSRRLDHFVSGAPLLCNGLLALNDGAMIEAYDLDGTLCWTADASGIDDNGAPKPHDRVDAAINALLIRVTDGLLVASMMSPTGAGLWAIDLVGRSVRPLDDRVRIFPPLAVPELPGHGRCLIGLGPRREVSYATWHWSVRAIRLDGSPVWEYDLETKPRGIKADAAGNVLVWSSTTAKRWKQYHPWYDMARECVVYAISATGQKLWTWQAPGPLTHAPVIGARGEVYVGSEGRLWALGGERSSKPSIRLGGVFDGIDQVSGRPVVAESHPRLEPAERDRVVAYLHGGAEVMTTTACDVDQIQPERGRVVPMSFRTDGEWVWSDEVAYYVSTYGLAPESELYRHIVGRAYRVAPPDGAAVRRAQQALEASG